MWKPQICAWQPVKVVPSLEEAEKAAKKSGQYRIWEISMDEDPVIVEEFSR